MGIFTSACHILTHVLTFVFIDTIFVQYNHNHLGDLVCRGIQHEDEAAGSMADDEADADDHHSHVHVAFLSPPPPSPLRLGPLQQVIGQLAHGYVVL